MNELIINNDGSITCIGDGGTVTGYLADLVKANTTPTEYNEDGEVTKKEFVPAADTLAIEITADDLKTHKWRLPQARMERLEQIRSARNAKLSALDLEYHLADEGVHPNGLDKAAVAAKKVVMRDLPPVAKSHLESLENTDDIAAYDPVG
tara:strand:- start:1974 stop:2423 length:450 start_codon:yes stop_codon:yes gene_type:complete